MVRSLIVDAIWRDLVRCLGRRHCGFVSGSAVVDWAVRALEAGWSSTSLEILAGLAKPPNEFEVDQYLRGLMLELGSSLPNPDEPQRLYARVLADDLASRRTPFQQAIRELHQLWLASGYEAYLSVWAHLYDAIDLAVSGTWGDLADVERQAHEEAARLLATEGSDG